MKAFDLVICKIDNDNGQQGVGIGHISVHENQGLAIASIIKNSFIPLLLHKDPRLIELHLEKYVERQRIMLVEELP